MHRSAVLFVILSFALVGAANATATSSPLTGDEKAFVATASSQLQGRYPNTATAKSGGYSLLYDTIDSDNTYNWTNFDFTHVAPGRPNFLWYDRQGHLAGADWELPKSEYPAVPHLAAYPVQSTRWVLIREHVHFAYTLTGKSYYGVAKAAPGLRQDHITADQLRASGAKLPIGATLLWAMYHPAVWDLAMWLVPNPSGAFAEKNPNVK